VLEHVAGIMALLLSAGTSRAEEGAYSNLDRLGNALFVCPRLESGDHVSKW